MGDRRTAVITGASSGIGQACAEAFAREGLHVVLAARRLDRLEHVAATIVGAGGAATPVACDVTDPAQVDRAMDTAIAATGRIDVMVCNAGLGYNGRLDETDADAMRRLMDVNYFGTFHAARAACRHFRLQRHGHIFIVSSIVGRKGVPRMGAYAATKFAQAGLGESVRAELAGTGIHVTLVYPISTETEFRSAIAQEWGMDVSGSGPRQSPEHVATTMVRALRRPRADVYPMALTRLIPAASALLPGLADWVSARFSRTPR
ncbi:MAG: SDR family NAD(P)-dependent oxidoreductase [Acidobacteria bacterium]|nr:SDR family NAD(P)-dependent oxidoreductase [Acidobacteriota bacterium]